MSKLLFLGTGSSTGVPVIGCRCSVCRSQNKKNVRLRPSALLTINNKKLLIDVGPDFRFQALKHNITELDALLISHVHFDHVAGLDDLRIYNLIQNRPMSCLLSEESLEELKHRFYYIFRPIGEVPSLSVHFNFHICGGHKGAVEFEKIKIDYVSYFQGNMKVTGFRIGNLAYITDISEYDSKIFESLKDLDVLVLSCLRDEVSPVHFNIEKAMNFAKKCGAKKSYFTHIAHELDHEWANKLLPDNMQLAYDGLELEF